MNKIIIIAAMLLMFGCYEPGEVEVDVQCPECEDCALTVDEAFAVIACAAEGGDFEQCFMDHVLLKEGI